MVGFIIIELLAMLVLYDVLQPFPYSIGFKDSILGKIYLSISTIEVFVCFLRLLHIFKWT